MEWLKNNEAGSGPYQVEKWAPGRGIPMFGGSGNVTTTDWPQPTPYNTDLSTAKQLLIEAGFPGGFETSLAFSIVLR